MATDTKGFFSSKAIWGTLIMLTPVIDQALTVLNITPAGTLSEATQVLVSTAGALLAIWGRIKAKKAIVGV